ncbi:3-ketoacyl-CoA synthase 4 [Dichanthelium oligosanthes]|uniref:very-long-chain 3-oxoacyl-CoA synthase n=1 Tax=Dichanthelium oligosanthes TaxID=888268 RepID=A0A1E5V377_9POAL|nr:3-ketoacyl-CoA synthase 4 [Dichanthelium oligosanthes]
MDVAHKDHLLAAARRAFGVAVLLLCLLAELIVFAFRRHSALHLFPACAMLLLWRSFSRRAAAAAGDVELVDFACLRPPRRLRIPIPALLEHLRLIGCFDEGSVEFMSRVIEACGMGEETYFPASLHRIPPSDTHADAVAEARAMFLPTLDALFARTGVPPSAVGALVVNCSGFCPAPSLAAAIAGHYRMRDDVRAFNLSGMGCAAGVVGVDVARGVLRAHAVGYAVVVSAEIVTVGWYGGRDRGKLLLNCFFRTGCSAALLASAGSAVSVPPKYRLVALARTNRTADERSYMSALREEDGEGITGFSISRGLGGVARDLLRAHLLALGPAILPWHEKLWYAAALLLFRRQQKRSKKKLHNDDDADGPRPNFLTAASHFCLPSSGMPMIRRLADGLGLGERESEAALMTFHRFGNQSAASLWYQLAYHEAKGRIRRGDRVWQLGMGSGPKANSAVWERVRGGDPDPAAADEGPWADCIHRFPNAVCVFELMVYAGLVIFLFTHAPAMAMVDMDIAHRDHLLAALHGLLGAATLLLCLLAELSVFAFRRHAAFYLAPVAAMLLFSRFRRRAAAAEIGLVDFSCLKPPRRLRIPVAGLLEHFRLIGCFDDGSVEFMTKVVEASGMGNETYFPPSLHHIPPAATHADAIQEAHMLFFPTLDDLFAKTGVPPSAVGALVVNCSGFCPAPSLAAIIANRYRMHSDVKTFNLSGMGCAAGVVGVDVARRLLLTHATPYAVVVSAEIVTVGWYNGKDQGKLLLNCYFRTGCSAALVTNGRGAAAAVPVKYRLASLTRTNQIANDRSYRSGYRDEDDEGITGFTLGQGVGRMVSELLRAHLVTLSLSILPWREKLRYVLVLLLSASRQRRDDSKLARGSSGGSSRSPAVPLPDFRAAADHFCLPSSGRPMIWRLGQGLGLGAREMEAALMTFHRFGNQSAASLWYQLAYLEAKGRVRAGDTVWQLGIGSGLKANSLVWERVAGHDGERELGPWADCIHKYPVTET